MATMTTNYHSTKSTYEQEKLACLSEKLVDDIESILDHFEVKYSRAGKKLVGPCPVHGGSGNQNWNLFTEGNSFRGNWRCHSQHCEQHFKASVFGLIRGLLSRQNGWMSSTDPKVGFAETVKWCEKWTKTKLKDIHIDEAELNKANFVSKAKVHLVDVEPPKHIIDRNLVRSSLRIPSAYFLKRGFSEKVLDKYDIGECTKTDPAKEMFQRAVIPIYDYEHNFLVGCSGRSVNPKCETCNLYHPIDSACPSTYNSFKFSKWKHSSNFKAERSLYNFWFAKHHILQTNTVILIESPADVLKLEDNGVGFAVASFGSSLTPFQQVVLSGSGAMNLVLIPNQDVAGKMYETKVRESCGRQFNIHSIDITTKDLAEMNNEQLKKEVFPLLQKLRAV